jgi:hypothetical protein
MDNKKSQYFCICWFYKSKQLQAPGLSSTRFVLTLPAPHSDVPLHKHPSYYDLALPGDLFTNLKTTWCGKLNASSYRHFNIRSLRCRAKITIVQAENKNLLYVCYLLSYFPNLFSWMCLKSVQRCQRNNFPSYVVRIHVRRALEVIFMETFPR